MSLSIEIVKVMTVPDDTARDANALSSCGAWLADLVTSLPHHNFILPTPQSFQKS